MTRTVLVVSYFYPPFASVGAMRVSKMTRYLADHGWRAEVLTIADDDRPGSMPLEIPAEAVHRAPESFDVLSLPRVLLGRRRLESGGTGGNAPSGWKGSALWSLSQVYRNVVCFPDPQVGWRKPAIREGLRVIEARRPSIILSSSLPNTSHLIASALAAKTGLPWIAELRDLWTENHNFRRVAPLRAIERRLERKTLSQANALVTVSESWAERLARMTGRPAYVVPNGFDPLDYPDAQPPASPVTLAYTGMFYNGKQNPGPVLEAIADLARAGTITPQTFRLRLAGYYLGPVLAAADALGVRKFVSMEPAVSYTDALRIQREAHMLLFLDWADGREKGWYSAKLYEYLGAARPILSIGPRDSAAGKLLAETRAGTIAQSAAEVRARLTALVAEAAAGRTMTYDPDRARIDGLTRQAAAGRMAALLEQYAAR